MSASAEKAADRFSPVWPVAWLCMGLAVILAVVAVRIDRAYRDFDEILVFAFVLTPLFGLLSLGMGGVWLFFLVKAVWSGQRRRFLSVLTAPFFAALAPAGYHVLDIDPRFLIERRAFDRAVVDLPEPPGARYKEFHWAETGFAGVGNTSSYIVYDETDALPRKIIEDTTRWPAHSTHIKAMGRHYYYVEEIY